VNQWEEEKYFILFYYCRVEIEGHFALEFGLGQKSSVHFQCIVFSTLPFHLFYKKKKK
jgi:hypothetical protein